MSREVYTFTLKYEAFKQLFKEQEDIDSFTARVEKANEKELEERKKYKSASAYKPLDAQEIIEHIQTAPHQCTTVELALVFSWLWETKGDSLATDEEVNTLFDQHGFTLIHEFLTKDAGRIYMQGMGAFMHAAKIDDTGSFYEGDFHLYKKEYYKRYLEYLLLLLSKIHIENTRADHVPDAMRELVQEYEYDRELNKWANEEIASMLIEHMQKLAEEKDKKPQYPEYITAYQEHINCAESLFYEFTEIKKLLADYTGDVFVHDSY